MNKSMSNSTISVGDFKEFYLQMSQPRSIRRLHAQLKEKFPKRKIISLATVFRHSQAERWKEQSVQVDSKVSEKILEKNVNAKVKEYDNITAQLESTSNKALQSVLDAFNKGIGAEIKKPEQILSLVKASVESIKMKNVLEGQPANLTGHIQYDSEDVVKLKQHIQELYQSINVDLINRADQKKIDNKKLN